MSYIDLTRVMLRESPRIPLAENLVSIIFDEEDQPILAVAYHFFFRWNLARANRIGANELRAIGSFDLAATSHGDNRNPSKPSLVVSSTTTRARRSFTIFQDENKRARRPAPRRIRRDISAPRARHGFESQEPVDNKRVAVLVKITSPYDSRSSYRGRTRVIITGERYSGAFRRYSCPFR